MTQRSWLFAASGTLVVSLIVFGLVLYFENESSKVGVEFQPTMDAAEDDIDEFWQTLLGDLGYGDAYESPENVVYYTPSAAQATACGEAIPNLAFYCGGDNTIYLDQVFLEQLFADYGSYAPIFVLSHEWGHAVQQSLGIPGATPFTIQTALQADCFAGMYSRDLDERDFITDEDLRGAITALILAADPRVVPWWSPEAQGTPQQRVSAFTAGYQGGWLECTRDPFVGPQVEPESG